MLVAALALASPASAQEQRITGRVVDAAEHTPIPAAVVLVTGTTVGANTNDSGTFTLRVPASARSLTVRRIGYLAQTVPVAAGQTSITVSLQRDVLRLEAEVVTGVATTVSTQNAANAAKLVKAAVAAIPDMRTCKCGSALAHALITDRKAIPEATLKKLELLVGKYVGK